MTDLRELAQPLLDDSPHPPPSIDELRRRVHRRRRRLARTIGSACVVVLVLLVAAVTTAVVRRDRTVVDVAAGPAATEPTVTDPVTTGPVEPGPPPLVPGPVQMVVSPETAALDIPRTIDVRNTGSTPYRSCAFATNLLRWTDERWEPAALVILATNPNGLGEFQVQPVGDLCTAPPKVVPAGTSTPLTFDLGSATWAQPTATPIAIDQFAPGWYELRDVPTAATPDGVPLGRFRITAPSTSESAPPTTIDPDRTRSMTISLWPDGARPLAPAADVLPTDVVAVDRDTIALAWQGSCNRPATSVEVIPSAGEVELRLHTGTFLVVDCTGDPDRWLATFDLPFKLDDDTRVVARTGDGEVARRPGPILGSISSSWTLPHGTPTSFQASVTDAPGASTLGIHLPQPLVDAGAGCAMAVSQQDDVAIPEVRVQLPSASAPVTACDRASLASPVADGTKVLGQE